MRSMTGILKTLHNNLDNIAPFRLQIFFLNFLDLGNISIFVHYAKDIKKFNKAHQECKIKGGDLASFSSESEYQHGIKDLPADVNVWIGLSDKNFIGRWTWSKNDEEATFTKWDQDQPGPAKSKRCVVVKNGFWSHVNCNQNEYSYLCEIPGIDFFF